MEPFMDCVTKRQNIEVIVCFFLSLLQLEYKLWSLDRIFNWEKCFMETFATLRFGRLSVESSFIVTTAFF